MAMQVFSFARIPDDDARAQVYQAIKNGKSRFGMWDQKKSLKEEWHGENRFLLRINPGDWIVHVNLPEYGKCVAVQAVGGYEFDEGVSCSEGKDFCNYILVDPKTMVEFSRTDANILPSVNLAPRSRYQRVLKVDDFMQSIENVKQGTHSTAISSESRGVVHLKDKISSYLLPEVTRHIHEMNKSKELELFIGKVFEAMPNVEVTKNGFGWKSDNGADLIVTFENPFFGVDLTTKLIVQVKSYSGDHNDLNAVDQVVKGIQTYKGDAGLIITTATATEALENKIRDESKKIGKPISLIAGPDVAKFVLRHAPDLLV